ncbi:hypothetical protein GUI37_06085 [Helcococcus kunzii]|uniref:DUF7336 domain-containing protein n=1 Tax=Helcococcus kunzii TaxID=40091 RepID=UPI001BAF9926|nr:hypothetical protein [Helcococcus kunzii]QUY65109.1 hypothetical protein GUI37_06085 [Helcococcus kunzii]
MDSTENTGAGSILGIYSSKERAKLKLAEYVIENKNPMYDYIEIVETEVEE